VQFNRVYGVDFSGGQNAHRHIWIATCEPHGERLQVTCCVPAGELGNIRGLAPALEAVRHLVASEPGSLFGMDFPFSIPEKILGDSTWKSFAVSLPERFAGPVEFCRKLHALAAGEEPKRACDREARTPFSAINLRIFRQTFQGIGAILGPLVRDDLACVLPMQSLTPGRAAIIEVCPASSLRCIGIRSEGYKGRTAANMAKREEILHRLTSQHGVDDLDPSLKQRVLGDKGGDALDAIIAATAAHAAWRQGDLVKTAGTSTEQLEGRVYYRLN